MVSNIFELELAQAVPLLTLPILGAQKYVVEVFIEEKYFG